MDSATSMCDTNPSKVSTNAEIMDVEQGVNSQSQEVGHQQKTENSITIDSTVPQATIEQASFKATKVEVIDQTIELKQEPMDVTVIANKNAALETPMTEKSSIESYLNSVASKNALGLLTAYETGSEDSESSSAESSDVECDDALYDTSSDSDSSDDSSSSSSSSSNDDNNKATKREAFLAKVRAKLDKEKNQGSDDEDDDGGNARFGGPKVRGELGIDELPPIEELTISVKAEECVELGKISSIVDQLVLVESLPGSTPVDLDTILFIDNGKKALGRVFDVFGQIQSPLYSVRFNSNDHIKENGIEKGQKVFVAPKADFTQFVVVSDLMKKKGCDASWENDVEAPERYRDYSDDEEERSAKRGKKPENNSNNQNTVGVQQIRPQRNYNSNVPRHRNLPPTGHAMNYRHQMMYPPVNYSQHPPQQEYMNWYATMAPPNPYTVAPPPFPLQMNQYQMPPNFPPNPYGQMIASPFPPMNGVQPPPPPPPSSS